MISMPRLGSAWPAKQHSSFGLALVVTSALVVVGATFYPSALAGAVVGLGIVAVFLRYPTVGLLCMMSFFLIQESPIYQTYGHLGAGSSAADAVGVVVLAGYLLRTTRADDLMEGLRRGGMGMLAVVAFSGWEVLSSVWSAAPYGSVQDFVRVTIEGPILFGLAILLLRTPQLARRAAAMYAITGVGLALYVIVNFYQHHGFDPTATQAYRGGLSQVFNPNEYAVELLLAPAFAVFAASQRPRIVRLLVAGASVPIVGMALLILASRTSFIALAAGVLASVLMTRNFHYRLAMAGLLMMAVGGFLLAESSHAVPTYFQSRFTESGPLGVANAGGRLPFWQTGFQLFARHPVAGIGAWGFENAIPSYHLNKDSVNAAHSDYVRVLVNTGLPGFLLLLGMLVALGRPIVRGRDPALMFIFTALIVAMTAGDFLLQHRTWVVLSIIYCCAVTVDSAKRRLARPSSARVPSRSPPQVTRSSPSLRALE